MKKKAEKLTVFQKTCLVRWINSCNLQDTAVTIENLPQELRNGVLLCGLLRFHQPALEFKGLSILSRAKQPCLNNLEMALQVMGQKGLPPRSLLTAEQLFEMSKVEQTWVMIKSVFDVFAMHDVIVLKPKILAWLSSIITYFNPYRASQQSLPSTMKQKEFYQYAQTGLPLFYIFHLYLKEPEPASIYEYPHNRQEMLSNLNIVIQTQLRINSPVYLTPPEYLERFEPQFLMLQLYYLFVKFRHLKVEPSVQKKLIFKDHGREPLVEARDESEVLSNDEEMQIIEEEDSLDFESSRRSKTEPVGPTPPRLAQSPLLAPKPKDIIVSGIPKTDFNSRNTFGESLTEPRPTQEETKPSYQLQMQHMGIFSQETSPKPKKVQLPVFVQERRMMLVEDLKMQQASGRPVSEKQLQQLLGQPKKLQQLLNKVYSPTSKPLTGIQSVCYLACPIRVNLSIQPRTQRQVHTTVAYLSLSFAEEDCLIFKDLDLAVVHKLELKDIESVQLSQGRIMVYSRANRQNPCDLVLGPVQSNSEVLCNALQNCLTRHLHKQSLILT